MEQDGYCKETSNNARTEQLVLKLFSMLAATTPFGRIRERFGKTAGVAKLSDVFPFQWTSPDSLEDKAEMAEGDEASEHDLVGRRCS